jgi:hypothetical protein
MSAVIIAVSYVFTLLFADVRMQKIFRFLERASSYILCHNLSGSKLPGGVAMYVLWGIHRHLLTAGEQLRLLQQWKGGNPT